MPDPLTQSSGQKISPVKQSSFQVSGLDIAAYPPGSTTGNVTTCPSMSVSTMVGDAFIKVINHMTAQECSTFHISGLDTAGYSTSIVSSTHFKGFRLRLWVSLSRIPI